MKFSIILFSAALCLLSSTEAGISTNSPYKAITWNGGDAVKVIWADDGTAPTLEEIGTTTIDLMAGGESIQVFVSNIGQAPATAKEIDYTVPKDIGPPGDNYFIKYTAGTYSSFSGTFTIAGISGVLGEAPKNGTSAASAVTPSIPATPAAPAAPTASTPNTNNPSVSDGADAAKSPLPSTLSGNAANLLPSFAGIATAAVALTITYLF